MNKETAAQLAEKAAGIAKLTAEALKHFGRDTAILLYAKQMGENNMQTMFPEGTQHKKTNNKEAAQKLDKMMADAKLKWKYAPDNDKRKVMDMEKIMKESDEKIKAVYAGVVAEAMAAT